MNKQQKKRGVSISRKQLMVFSAIVIVLMASFFIPDAGVERTIFIDILGTNTPVVIDGVTHSVPKAWAQIFGLSASSAAGYWDCGCTWWDSPVCGGTCNVYHGSTLYDSYYASCDASGFDQDGRPCTGCCFRIDCTWVVTSSPPTIDVTTSCSRSGSNGWCVSGGKLNISANEPQGDPMTVTCTTPTVNATGSASVGLPQGSGTANCTVTSAAGSASDTVAWKFDSVYPTVTPVLTGTLGGGGWYTSNVNVAVTGTDATSGVRSKRVQFNGSWYAGGITITNEGSTYLLYEVTDRAGNTAQHVGSVKIDRTAPVLQAYIFGWLGSNGWYISNPTIFVEGSDAHSGVATERVEVSGLGWQNSGYTIAQDGSYSLGYEVTDVAGHTTTGSGSVKVDATAPTLSLNITGGGGLNGWHTAPLSVAVSGSDATSGLDKVEMRVNSGAWQAGPVAFGSDGIYSVAARSVDNAGNLSQASDTIRVDMTNPTLAESVIGTLGSSGWYVSPVDASVSGSDALSGVDAEQIQVNSGGWGGNTTTIASEGTFNISFRVIDMAGNTISAAESVSIDLNPPEIKYSISGGSGGYYGSAVTITGGSTDSASGVASEEVRIDGGAWAAPGTFTLADGDHTIEYRVTDHAGHVSTVSETITVDISPPSVSLEMPNTCSGELTFTGSAADTSGISSAEIVIDGSSNPILVGGGGDWSYTTRLSDGSHSVVVKITDGAGNLISETGNFGVDNTPPDIDLDPSWEDWSYGALSVKDTNKFSVTISGTGPGYNGRHGFRSSNYPDQLYWRTIFPAGVWGDPGDFVRINVTAEDECGNIASKAAQIVIGAPSTPTPTLEFTSTPAATTMPTQQPPEATPMAHVQATEVVVVEVEEFVEAVGPMFELFHFPLWLWALLASAMIIGAAGVFLDPRPKQINRHSDIKESAFDYFVDSYEE